MSKNPIYLQTISATIGLVRSVDLNHIEDQTTSLLIQVLKDSPTASDDKLQTFIKELTSEKKRLVPDCFSCTSPCGRTFNYDMSLIPEGSAKWDLLKYMHEYAKKDLSSGQQILWLYRGIFQLGEYLDDEFIRSVIHDIQNEG